MPLSFRNSIFIFLFAVLSCSSNPKTNYSEEKKVVATQPTTKEHFATGEVIANIACKSNASYSFDLFLPKAYDGEKKFPVIIFFDPHGKGNFPLTMYQHLAERFGFVLMGSDDSKNGLAIDETNNIASALVSDAITRLNVDEHQIALAGFSGGAKVAMTFAAANANISSVIYGGAFAPVQNATHPLEVLGFAGVNDMNYSDLIGFDQSFDQTHVPHFLIEWNGKHEWADTSVFEDAFYFEKFLAMKNHFVAVDSSLIKKFLQQNGLGKSLSDPMMNAARCNKIDFFLSGIYNIDAYTKQYNTVVASDDFKKQQFAKQQLLTKEQNTKQEYIKALAEKDFNWWDAEIRKLQNGSSASEKQMNQRLLGFISLACYSLSNNALQQNQFPMAQKMLAIYKTADPANADQAFFEACYYAKQNQSDKAIASLTHAINLGLNDKQKVMNEPMLASLHENTHFREIVATMK